MDIEIKIKGSVICYLKNDGWHFVFVTDKTHLAKLSVNDETPFSLRKAGVDRKITLDFRGKAEPPAKEGNTFGDILNIAGAEMHGDRANGKGEMNARRRETQNTEIVQMLIPAGELARDDWTKEEYYVKEIGVDLQRCPIGRKIAASVKLEIKTDAPSIALIIDGEEQSIPPSSGNPNLIKLEFDNFCGEIKDDTDENNDFQLYYDWLEDARDKGRRFVAGKIPRTGGIWDTESTAEKVKMIGRQGNCDPISVDPPPTVGDI